MKLTILGSGTCASQLPGIPNRYPPGFLVEWGNEKILFECSEGIRFRLEQTGYDFADIHHLAITHAHPDHYALAHFLQSVFCTGIWGGTKNTLLNIYAPRDITEKFSQLQEYYFSYPKNFENPKLNLVTLPSNPIILSRASLTAAHVYHDFGKIESLAFRLETPEGIFVYSGDTGDCPGIREISKEADIFVCECTASINDNNAPTKYGHLNPRTAGDIAKQSNVKQLVLFHYTGLDSDADMLDDCRKSGFSGEIILAKDFAVI